MKTIIEVLKEVSDRLETLGIDYMVVGSVGSMIYGQPRSTLDIDLVVQIKSANISKFEKAFPQPEYYCPPTEILADEIAQQGQFNLIHIPSGIKIDIILIKNTEFYKSEFSRRKKISFLPEMDFYVASPEDIIIKKLDYYREGGSDKHLSDIRSVLSFTNVDRDYIEKWVNRLGLTNEWAQVS